ALPVAASADTALPAGFTPSSTWWTSDDTGFVLGFAPCGSGQCAALARTVDGGATWRRTGAPPVPLTSVDLRPRVRFANDRDGVITDGHTMYSTHTGGTRWRKVELSGVGPEFDIGELA